MGTGEFEVLTQKISQGLSSADLAVMGFTVDA
jgi:hypothetical protein